MKIGMFFDIVGVELKLTYHPNQYGRWCCGSDLEVKSGRFLSGVFGNGKTPDEAIASYANEIKGKIVVKRAFYEDRHEFNVPSDLRG